MRRKAMQIKEDFCGVKGMGSYKGLNELR